ncbi:hypothetical protein ACFY3M_47725 [Streptomyces mirabilis]|uniref:hypothetical protein n=1 Tax=Streptomyces mirabilis TaxID=68239 RepID=UPI00368CE4C7
MSLSVRSVTTGRTGHPLTFRRDLDRTDDALPARLTRMYLYPVVLDTGRHVPVSQLVLVTPSGA